MKNISGLLCLMLLLSFPVLTHSQNNYQSALNKLNAYLKTFDNGYYGYFEVKDGYLWGRFASGDYTKTTVGELGTAAVTAPRTVQIYCIDTLACVYSTYTSSYHSYLTFSQYSDYNTGELVTLWNNFISAYKGKTTTSSTAAHTARLQSQGERVKPHTGNIDPAKYSKQLAALNTYLKTFNSATYGEVTVKDGKVYFDFKVSGTYYSYITISDLLNQTSVLKMPDEIKIACNSGSKCFYSSYLKNNTDHFRFYSLTVKDLSKMKQLVDDFVNALR